MYIDFEWHEAKNRSNQSKHGASFEEARTVFFDEHALFEAEHPHPTSEERFALLGMSHRLRLLKVTHTYRAPDEIIRIISARPATKNEARTYWKRMSRDD